MKSFFSFQAVRNVNVFAYITTVAGGFEHRSRREQDCLGLCNLLSAACRTQWSVITFK